MSFSLGLTTDNDAFREDLAGEVARLLRRAAELVEGGADFGSLLDGNGNGCGQFILLPGDAPRVFAAPHDPDGSIPDLVPALSVRAAAMIQDHRRGEHEAYYDDTIGCSFPGCEDAFWAWARAQEAAR